MTVSLFVTERPWQLSRQKNMGYVPLTLSENNYCNRKEKVNIRF